jgi:hypothetical protein
MNMRRSSAFDGQYLLLLSTGTVVSSLQIKDVNAAINVANTISEICGRIN